ncbi:LmbU family transcriptional regulator [Saccharothrix australiensis]|uniref:LmbU family transcriptional regulator n=1 Tax=Saccharothrix australiensis TaxID=2072 RepID=UPI001FE7C8CC|nr:LmbU family transcriptional regulator [Saccharothrix australiensis]
MNSGPTSTARPVLTKRTSLALPARIPLEDWRGIGQHISAIAESSAWWLGDWLIYGQEEYPDRYRRAIEETGLDYQTLRNYAWVARRFPPARRRAALSFQHHAELASLTAGEQDEWLDRAEEFRWSRNELRNRVRVGRRAVKPAEDARLRVDIIPDQRQRWQDAAATAEQDLLTWIVSVLDEAAADPPVD